MHLNLDGMGPKRIAAIDVVRAELHKACAGSNTSDAAVALLAVLVDLMMSDGMCQVDAAKNIRWFSRKLENGTLHELFAVQLFGTPRG